MLITIRRAHDYAPIERLRADLSRLPAAWRDQIADVPFYVLPADLSPLWIGLMRAEDVAHDGRAYSTMGAWAARYPHPNWADGWHVYLADSHLWAAVHEVGHMLESLWHAPVEALYRPDQALYPYMATNPDEFFACAVDAWCWPERDDLHWNRADLWRSCPDIARYLAHREAT